VIADWWAAGRVDRLYDAGCYRQALASLAPDWYGTSTLDDDLRRAARAARDGRLVPRRR
jgi:hypothetical protein